MVPQNVISVYAEEDVYRKLLSGATLLVSSGSAGFSCKQEFTTLVLLGIETRMH